jgi:16S rRNA U516 pseudouridylate synthase RsuA-like enzyme
VKVNGRVIQTPDHWVDIGRDKIALDGKRFDDRAKAGAALEISVKPRCVVYHATAASTSSTM